MTTDEFNDWPTVWAICDDCRGSGTRSLGGASFTASEWAEWDQDERDEYREGFYDRPCSACEGSGKVLEPDTENMSADQLEDFRAWLDCEAESAAEACYFAGYGS